MPTRSFAAPCAHAAIALAVTLLAGCGDSATVEPDPRAAQKGLTALVNPFVGTQAGAADFGTGGGAGNTFPGATLPFGMVQFSPDTDPSTDNFAGGYTYSDTRIRGFSLTHVSGAGCGLFGDLPLLPLARAVTASPVSPGSAGLMAEYPAPFDHAHEQAAPGYYAVVLDPASAAPVDVELTATPRGGMARIRYPAGQPASLLWNAGGSIMANSAAAVTIDPARREISGSATSGRFCFQDNHYTIYFAAQFDRPFASTATWQKQLFTPGGTSASDSSVVALNYMPFPGGPAALPGDPSGTAQAGAVVTFEPASVVEVRIGISWVSVENARENLAAEVAGRGFEALRAQADASWEAELGRVEVDTGDRRLARMFYTALYHSLLSPYLFSDVNGDYLGMDGQVRRSARPRYHTISGWDIYRSQVPLLAMLDPARTSDIVDSMLANAAESGWLPKWSHTNQHTDTMVGDPADIIIAGAHAFGARDFDVTAALAAMLKGATESGQSDNNPDSVNNAYVERQGLPFYDALGYVPLELDVPFLGGIGFVASSQYTWGSAATTLEYAAADYAIGRFAEAIGQGERAGAVAARGGHWRNVFNPETLSVEPRSALGLFNPDYDPAGGDGFVEGNGAQYTWFVPHDLAGLVEAMGGPEAAASRLDGFFTQINAGPKAPYAFMGNEPCLSAPWIYAWLRQPWKTSPLVRSALTTLYDDAPTGMPGNDDLGTMSAWWVLASLGFNPGIPGTDVLLLNQPLFGSATLHLPGRDLRISADGAGPYLGGVALDGRALDRAWLRFGELANGAQLRFTSATAPAAWATSAESAPP